MLRPAARLPRQHRSWSNTGCRKSKLRREGGDSEIQTPGVAPQREVPAVATLQLPLFSCLCQGPARSSREGSSHPHAKCASSEAAPSPGSPGTPHPSPPQRWQGHQTPFGRLSPRPLTAASHSSCSPRGRRVGLGESPGPRRQRLTPEHLNPSSGQDHRLPQPPSPVSIL